MMRTLSLTLITEGDPAQLTGGYVYHQRMAAAAPSHRCKLAFASLPRRPFPLGITDARGLMRSSEVRGADALLLDSIAAAFVAPWLPRERPVIAIAHQPPGGIDHGRVRTVIQARLDMRAYRRTAGVIAASEFLAGQFKNAGVDDARMSVVPPGRDLVPAASEPVADLRRGRSAAFLSVANWLPRKGIDFLLDAFARLPPEAATLHLVGRTDTDAGYTETIRRRLKMPDLRGRVVVHGPLPAPTVAALYRAADAFVLPSLREPYGTVWAEAMAAGLPVIGFAAGNLPYLAHDRIDGLLVAPKDSGALSQAMLTIAQDEGLRHRLGSAARERAAAWPTWAETATRFFAEVRRLARL